MDKYEVIKTLGEGSFGRVYQAKQLSDGCFVALKVISKRGRSNKELKGFRRECEIQRNLHHPNIIQMLDSFETENEIVVITEFAHKELTDVLRKSCFLVEKCVQQIVWDLVSALFYLHSNRILHRDLKPQNILLDVKNCAKLCDFGFARNMSTGTHVLTSIKGTPLYMAPELIDEQPYDYAADLWSLGCIIYELLMGTPPFCTTSILNLIKLVRDGEIRWPTFVSDNCMSFLKGLLQKNPAERMTWDQILHHSFVKGHILISNNSNEMPLTKPMTPNTLQLKEQQRKESIIEKHARSISARNSDINDKSAHKKINSLKVSTLGKSHKSDNPDVVNNNLVPDHTIVLDNSKQHHSSKTVLEYKDDSESKCSEKNTQKGSQNSITSTSHNDKVISSSNFYKTFDFIENTQPIETEEWIVFLQRSIQEVITGEMTSLTQSGQANVLVSPLRNANADSKVLSYIAKLLSLPFVVRGVPDDCLLQIKKVYLEVKLVPNLVYAAKLILREQPIDTASSSPSPMNSPLPSSIETYRSISDINPEDFQALEFFFLLLTHLVYSEDDFLVQFCDSVAVLNVYVLMRLLLLLTCKQKLRIVADVLAILTQLLRKLPENSEVIEKILLSEPHESDVKRINFVELLRHSSSLIRERTCYFLKVLNENILETFWSDALKETLEALMYDSMEGVRNAAEVTVLALREKDIFFK